jgi:hypothetical protein
MGFSTPKTPFNLSEFLSQKGTPRNSRKPNWKRAPQAPLPEVEETEVIESAETAEATESPEAKADIVE